jgi:hypothetical protein
MIGRQVLPAHAEAVAALGVQVQFCRFVSVRPALVQGDAFRRESERIVGCGRNKHGRCVGWNGNVFRYTSARINRGDEGGPAFGQVMERNSGRDSSPGGEPNNADAVRGHSPLRSVLSHVGDRRQAVGDGQRNDLADGLAKFLPVGSVVNS